MTDFPGKKNNSSKMFSLKFKFWARRQERAIEYFRNNSGLHIAAPLEAVETYIGCKITTSAVKLEIVDTFNQLMNIQMFLQCNVCIPRFRY